MNITVTRLQYMNGNVRKACLLCLSKVVEKTRTPKKTSRKLACIYTTVCHAKTAENEPIKYMNGFQQSSRAGTRLPRIEAPDWQVLQK